MLYILFKAEYQAGNSTIPPMVTDMFSHGAIWGVHSPVFVHPIFSGQEYIRKQRLGLADEEVGWWCFQSV